MNLAQLQEEYKLKLQADEAALAERIEVARLQAKIETFNNPILMQARVAASIDQQAASKLKMLNDACAAVVASMPIYSNRTRENYKW